MPRVRHGLSVDEPVEDTTPKASYTPAERPNTAADTSVPHEATRPITKKESRDERNAK